MSNWTQEERRDKMFNRLLELGIYKRDDGKQLYELSSEDLEEEIKKVMDLMSNYYGLNRKTS